MKPNLESAQGIPGRNEGRSTGIIETKALVPVVEAVGLLQKSAALSPEDLRGLQMWFADYVAWLQNSDAGKEEGESDNNHALAYDLQLISFALFSNHVDIAREIVTRFAHRRIVPQFASDGRLPEELARTRSFHYSLLALDMTMDVATLGECVGLDLWRFQKSDGGGLRASIDFLIPYIGREAAWPYPETKDASAWHEYEIRFHDLLLQAAWAYEAPLYAAKAAHYEAALSNIILGVRVPEFGK